ncbi:MAG: adenylate/guanylate cyclase domain-containing protein [Cyclobacteriaceae bacterium]|nr:adenylate/guanylate cyclase domain-containing protein [Cyclobacteriaceae bacterium]
MKAILEQINSDVKDIFNNKIETTGSYVVPSRNDAGLTFKIGDVKKGKTIETCVLMVDMRNSTKISKQLSNDKARLGKIYSAFIHAMATIADEYGYVRNIIGDRVMVVFDPKDCHVNALTCAVLMNTVITRILSKYVALDDFKVGIGIDYGEMLVLKTGIRKKHEEQSEYKNLVWVGDTANIASKLTDAATKEIKVQNYKVKYEPWNHAKSLGIGSLFSSIYPQSKFAKPTPLPDYLPLTEKIFTEEEITQSLHINGDKNGFTLHSGKIHTIEKLPEQKIYIPNILMTENVYSVLKNKHPERIYKPKSSQSALSLRIPYYKEVSHPIKDVNVKVYGGGVYYSIVDEILK